jgi:hypothetical protein
MGLHGLLTGTALPFLFTWLWAEKTRSLCDNHDSLIIIPFSIENCTTIHWFTTTFITSDLLYAYWLFVIPLMLIEWVCPVRLLTSQVLCLLFSHCLCWWSSCDYKYCFLVMMRSWWAMPNLQAVKWPIIDYLQLLISLFSKFTSAFGVLKLSHPSTGRRLVMPW